jgi:uncharacterized protein YigE (DUF2233 family)
MHQFSLAQRRVARGKRIIFIFVFATVTGWMWIHSLGQGIAQNGVSSACISTNFEEDRFILCQFDPAKHDFAMKLRGANGTPLRSFSALAKLSGLSAQRIVFAMNAGMYDLAGNPIGLYVENKVELVNLNRRDGPGNFHMKPNGVFWLDSIGVHVNTTQSYAATSPKSTVFATQSGPMLVIDGVINAQFSSDGTSRHIRNGVCTPDGKRISFLISQQRVSFGKFARAFRDLLHCRNALYLDGLVSSLWDGASGRVDQRFPLGPMIIISEKAQKR